MCFTASFKHSRSEWLIGGDYWSSGAVTDVACTAVTRHPELGSWDGNSLLITPTGYWSCLSMAGAAASLNPLKASKRFGLQGVTCLAQGELKESPTHSLKGQMAKWAQTWLYLWHLQPSWLEKDGRFASSETFLQGWREISSKPSAEQDQAIAAMGCLLLGGQWERKGGLHPWRRVRECCGA